MEKNDILFTNLSKLYFLTTFNNKCLPTILHYEYDAFLSYSGQELNVFLKGSHTLARGQQKPQTPNQRRRLSARYSKG